MAATKTNTTTRILARKNKPVYQFDIHADDTYHRGTLHATLHAIAATRGTPTTIAKASGLTRATVRAYMRSTNLRMGSLQQYARALDCRIHPYIDTSALTATEIDIIQPTDRDMVRIFDTNPHPERQDQAIRFAIGETLKSIRVGRLHTTDTLANACGADAKSISQLEEGDNQNWVLGVAQRLFRALDAPLRFAVEDRDGTLRHIPWQAPTDDHAAAADHGAQKVELRTAAGEVFLWHQDRPDSILMFTSVEWQAFLNGLADQ
jgi:transcriptional regulator with XRE-family HTH domain